ncbi:adenylate/guanylate cyclase domain-containing protein [Albimonas sp. CAU 1670]|uniref:adenylate/guanylate cyclase domain-containing protein n=1 Tax=Albimonas sp. CAU 1670 TaxID=3032599 RepID=UPI0023D9BB36|nr:adenylate/guanylate cyclase domain-containing protein [Albimonas sp. CAU 1670]MDF2233487.1 adenylate/guanylate cyclase domain-containing protein [Albimonas sp. CAU 1670]
MARSEGPGDGPRDAQAPPVSALATTLPAAGTAETRIDRIMAQEAAARAFVTARVVTVALVVLAPLVLLVAGWPEGLYHISLMPLFAGSVWSQAYAARRWGPASWRNGAIVAFNFALMAFTLYFPNPFNDPPLPASAMLHFGNTGYFFVMLAALAFSFSPGLVLWGGVCATLFSALARLWMLSQPGVSLAGTGVGAEPVDQAAYVAALEESLSVFHIDPGVWIQEAVVFMVVSGMLAQAARLSRRTARRGAALERRGANLARYLPAQMAERMAEADAPFGSDRRAVAAILFTDVVGFTGWAEDRDPAEVAGLLREVHGVVAQEVFRARGVLDKFIGDGAMASFGLAPHDPDRADPAELAARALGCAEAILAGIAALNARRGAAGLDPVRLSIGVHLGPVVVGDVGAEGRMELATVGDAVNVASRMEALTRPLGCAACASGAVIDALGAPPAGWTYAGERALPGRRGAEPTWTRG